MNAANRKSTIPIEAVIYAFAHVECWLEDYAKSHQLSSHELTGGVAGLLLGTAGGEVLGPQHSMPGMRRAGRKTATIHKASRKMALVERPHGDPTQRKASKTSVKRHLSAAARRRISKAQKLRWQKYHELKAA